MGLDPKNTVETLKHLKIQHIFNTLKSTLALVSAQKNTDLRNDQILKKYSADPCL